MANIIRTASAQAGSPTPNPTACSGIAPPSGMIGWWPGDGNANDIVGTNNGTLQNGGTFAAGKVAQAFSLNGVNQSVLVADAPSLSPQSAISIDAWYSATPTGNYQFLVNKFNHNNGTAADDSYALGIHPDGTLRWQVDVSLGGGAISDNYVLVNPGNALDGQLHFIAATYDGSAMKLYFDGALVGTTTVNGSIVSNTTPLFLGGGQNVGNQDYSLKGTLDEVEIFNRALAANELLAIYNAGSAGKCKSGSPTPSPSPSSCTTSLWSGEGNANDTSGVNNGMLKNGATFAAGQPGQAFNLDGNSAYVEAPINTPEFNAPTSFTWEAWINPTSLASNPVVFSKEGDVYNRAGLQILANGSLCSYINSGYCAAISAPGLVSTCEFSKVTLLYDGSTQNLVTYVNGAPVSRATVGAPYNTSAPFNIGWSPFGFGNSHFPGRIDEVSFSSCAVPPTTSQSIATGCGVNPTPTPTPGSCSITIFVPGTSNPYLAGMPAGSTDYGYDSVPANSPALVSGITVTSGAQYRFAATGAVHLGDGNFAPPDGINGYTNLHNASNGIGGNRGPANALLGVFLSDSAPNTTPAPDAVDLYAVGFDQLTNSPALKQPFFIGDGKTSSGAAQTIVAPAGATRLFLATQDGFGWYNNAGAFDVTITPKSCSDGGSKPPMPVITGGLPGDSGLLGPGDPNNPGHVSTVVTGTGNAGCTIQLTVTDPHETGGNNNRTLTTTVDASGNWALPLTLDDCDPFIDIVMICGGVSSDSVRRHIYVDGTQPAFIGGGPGEDETVYIGGGSSTGTIIIDGSGSDPNTYHCVGNCGGVSYEWYIIGSGGVRRRLTGGGGAGGTFIQYAGGPGSGLRIELEPGDYEFDIEIIDAAGNRTKRRCRRHVILPRPVTITGGLPENGGIYGPGEAGTPGRVRRTISGTGNPNCTVKLTVSDPEHPASTNNNTTHSVAVDSAGNWALDLTLDDCHPFVEIVQECGGGTGEVIRRQIYVDGTPPRFVSGGPSDGVDYVAGGGGTARVVLVGTGTDEGTHIIGGGVSYRWRLIGGGAGGTDLELGLGGGSFWRFTGGGGSLEIDLRPGSYEIEVEVCDAAGNCIKKRCRRVVRRSVTLTSGLPEEGGIMGPRFGYTVTSPGKVRTRLIGTGDAGCTVNIKVSDPDHAGSLANNQTYAALVDTDGNWALDLELDDCHPVIEITQVCDGETSGLIRRQVYVDGTAPKFIIAGGPGDGVHYVGSGGTARFIIDGGASDEGTHVIGGGVSYRWFRSGAGGSELTLIEGANGSSLDIELGPGSYLIKVEVTDEAGNKLYKICRHVVRRPLSFTSGLPQTGGIMGPGTGYTVVGEGGRVRTRLVGTGEPGCTIEIKVTDPTHAVGTLNNRTYTTTVDASGNWSLDLELDDCHPVIEIRQVCDGEAGEIIRRQIYVDTTRPSASLADQRIYVGTNGEVKIVLNPGASDDSHVPGNVLTYEWFLVGASRTALCTGCPGVLEIIKGVGEYEIEVVITDSAGNKTTKRCRVSVLKRPTEIVCVRTVVDFAGIVTLNYTLKDKLTGEVLTRTIKYKLNGNEIASTFEAYLLPGLYNIVAEFAGDAIYGACSTDGSSCPLEVRATPGKITGGGSIDQRLRNFGFVVQTKSQGGATLYTGNLEYQEKPLGYSLRSQSITVIAISADRLHGVFAGTATMNGRAGYTFTVFVDDLAEPGAQVDKFRIEIKGPDGFTYDSDTKATQGGKLDQGGNIQIHKAN